MNNVQMLGVLADKPQLTKVNGKALLTGTIKVGNPRGYDYIPFEIWNIEALKFSSNVTNKDEVLLIGSMQSRKENEDSKQTYVYFSVKKFKIVK